MRHAEHESKKKNQKSNATADELKNVGATEDNKTLPPPPPKFFVASKFITKIYLSVYVLCGIPLWTKIEVVLEQILIKFL